jgi:hypothetical protein
MQAIFGLLMFYLGYKIVDGLIRVFSGHREIITPEELKKLLTK